MKKLFLTITLSLLCFTSILAHTTRDYSNFPVEIRPVKTISEYFTGDWEVDSARIRKLIAYMRQGEKKLDRFDQNCQTYKWVGEYKEVLTADQRATIHSIQTLHLAGTSICTLTITEPAWSMPSGEMFLNPKITKRLSLTHFTMLIGHETAHRYTSRMFVEGAPDLFWQTELFADAVALWSLICLGGDVTEGVNYLQLIPGREGGRTHPPHTYRKEFMTGLAQKWLASKGKSNGILTSSFAVTSPTRSSDFLDTELIRPNSNSTESR